MFHQESLGSWVVLPVDVLELILNNLSFADHARCSAVCKHWNSVVSTTLHFKSLHLPWLLLSCPDDRSTTSHKTWGLYSPLERRPHELNELSAFRGSRVLRSCGGGWLLTRSNLENLMYSFLLLNPFTNRSIHLPRSWYNYGKGVSSSAPPNCNFVVHHYSSLAFCRPGDEEWSCIEIDDDYYLIHDIAFFKGLLYCAAYRWGTLSSVVIVYEFGPQPVRRNAYTDINRLSIYDSSDDGHDHIESIYLVESAGELLMVIELWHGSNNIVDTSTVHVGVYRLDPCVQGWVEVRSLGDEALIIGSYCSSSINPEKLPGFGINRNHVYFTTDPWRGFYFWREFCLENQIIQPFSPRVAAGSPPLESLFLCLMLDV